MGRFFWVDEDDAVAAKHGGEAHGAHKWKLPGVSCHTCGATWGAADHQYPCVDLSQLPERKEFEKSRPEPFPEFARLRELVRPLAPPNATLPPATRFGPLVGNAFGKLPAFSWIIEVLLVHREALERLQAEGVRHLELDGLTIRELPTR